MKSYVYLFSYYGIGCPSDYGTNKELGFSDYEIFSLLSLFGAMDANDLTELLMMTLRFSSLRLGLAQLVE